MVLRQCSGRRLACLLLSFFALVTASDAHHSYVGKYDPKKSVTIRGTISSVSCTNPHIFFTVATSGGSWRVETESIQKANARGLTKALLAAGKKVSVTGWRARSGGASIGMRSITIGGRTITMRSTAR